MSLNNAVKNALPYAQALAQAGKRLALPANSDFVPLVRAAAPFGGCRNGATVGDFLSMVSENASIDHGFNEYEEISGSLKTTLTDLVRGHIRNSQKVATMVTNFAEKVKGYANSLPDTSAMGRFTVVEDQLCDVFEGDYFQDLISTNVPAAPRPDSNLCSRPRTHDEIMAMLASEDKDLLAGLNRAMSFYALDMNGRPRQILEEIFSGMICGHDPQSKGYVFYEINKLPAGERLVVALVTYLLAQKLRAEVPEDAIGNLNSFTANCNNLAAGMHNVLVSAFKEKKYAIENGLLILNAHPTETSVIVEKTVYQAFLEAGGSVEVILGSKVGRLNLYTATEISEGALEAARAWSVFAQLNNATADNERRSYMRATYKAAWAEAGEDILDFEAQLRNSNLGLFSELTKEAYDYIEAASLEELNCIDVMAECLIAKLRFSYTPSYIYITEMKKREKEGAGAREDALVATIKYLCLYALTQITVTNV